MLFASLFLAGCAVGALLVLGAASPGPWPPPRTRKPAGHRLRQERDSWLR